jgi:type III restriction enzyme
LEDAISIHEDTKNELEIYSRTNGVQKIKPFILVVCKDTTHAKDVFDYINSKDFYRGNYEGKVLQIDSTTKNTEDIEKQFLNLEHPENDIEIVIHVNMLKEGWDVKNLYTIVPLRAANASVLIEQTIGRGLRLPYKGERTGVDKVDKLTVVAHDNFQKVIIEAQNPNSVLNKMSFIEISEEDLNVKAKPIVSFTKTELSIQAEEKKIAVILNKQEKQDAKNTLDAKRLIIETLNDGEVAYQTKGLKDFNKPEIKEKVQNKFKEKLNKGQLNIFKDEIEKEFENVYEQVLVDYKNNIIEIPRIDLVQDDVKVWFEDFNLNTEGLSFNLLDEEIMVRGLKDNKIDTIGVLQGAFTKDTPVNQIVSELINSPEVDYDENSDLLHKLASQAITSLENQIEDITTLRVLVRQYRKVIAGKIYDQLKEHFRMSEPQYKAPNVLPFRKIEEWNFTALDNGFRDYRDIVSPVSLIPKLVFRGFEKACHLEYKFDSKTEKDFAFILENDKNVLKWLRPAPNQFRIYWANNSKQYYPDFVVETDDMIFMVETKAEKDLDTPEVLDKMRAAMEYCKYATEFTNANDGKEWKYMLIPHNEVSETTSLSYLIANFSKVD